MTNEEMADLAERFREALRYDRLGSQGALSARTVTDDPEQPPIGVPAISAIETGTTLDPGILTVIRLVKSIPGLTLAEFFARIDGPTDLSDRASIPQTPPHGPTLPAVAGDDTLEPFPPDAEIARALDTIRSLGKRFEHLDRRSTEGATPNRGPAAAVGPPAPQHDLHHRRRARRTPRPKPKGRPARHK
jgi:hypothetical protein